MNVRRSRRGWWLLLAFGLSATSLSLRAAAPSGAPVISSAPSAWQSVRPYWVELTVAQRDALKPLAEDWERLDVQTKKKWVEIANRYPRMQPEEQGRTQQRMREWARLTPEQRRTARDSFARVRAMNPDQRADMLRKYQELPPERKQALTNEGQASRMIVVPKQLPSSMPAPRRAELSEGARVPNPAIAAQKNANPIVAPAKKVVPPAPAPAAIPAPSPDAVTAPVVPASPPAPASPTATP